MNGRVIVVGSVNVDLVVRVGHLPSAGETVAGGTFAQHHGGKGGNQAVAARRLGAPVEFIGAVGSDAFGEAAIDALAAEGVGTTHVLRRPDAPTGVALILVDASGENVIAVAPGANATLGADDAREAMAGLAVGPDDVVLVSHELPTATVRAALVEARRAGARSVFNPAPAAGLDRGTTGLADLLTPNRQELTTLVVEDAARVGRPNAAADAIDRQARLLVEPSAEGEGPRLGIVVTLGARGVLLVVREDRATRALEVPAVTVPTVDATGAGDAFNGALADGLLRQLPIEDAVRRAVVAAGLATTQVGAREGMPTANELARALG